MLQNSVASQIPARSLAGLLGLIWQSSFNL